MKYLQILVWAIGMMGVSCEESPHTRPLPNSAATIKYTVYSNGMVFNHLYFIDIV